MSTRSDSDTAVVVPFPLALDTYQGGSPERAEWDCLRIGEPAVPVEPARIEVTASEGAPGDPDDMGLLPGAVIAGRYTLLQRLGAGGMGEVWVAGQAAPVERKVALKLVKPGMDSRAVLARFAQERQAVAMMDHPNIAKVFDAGVTAEARPFFVMELVDGVPLNRYCDQRKLSLRERLELFIPVCQAVQHAHQKGIVHRDLKPGNILVAAYDSGPVPKVIDFGVAKAIGGKLTDETLATQFGGVVGTLEYMSPEQAGLSGARDVDTRADIYSLGVVLYELLTGLRPFDSRRLHSVAPDEVARILRDEDPPPPLTRLSSDNSLRSVATGRQSEPRRLLGSLRGELDWVVMKCLAKDRKCRYETANGLARDLQRYLTNQPVEARPPSARYRCAKFLRRHQGAVVAASLVLLALVGGVVGTSWGLVRAEQRRVEAERARLDESEQRRLAQDSARDAQRRLGQVQRANGILGSIFADLDPNPETKQTGSLRVILGRRLDEVASQVQSEAVGDAVTVAKLQNLLGVSQRNLGYPEKAIALLTRARATLLEGPGPADPLTIEVTNNLAVSYVHAGRVSEAIPLFEQALATRQPGAGAPDPLVITGNLADAYAMVGRLDEALPLLEETLAKMTAGRGPDHVHTLAVMNNLARAYTAAERFEDAIRVGDEALRRHAEKLGATHRQTLICMGRLADAYYAAGRLTDALPLYERSRQALEQELGASNADTLVAMSKLAWALQADGQVEKALSLFEQALAGQARECGRHHPETLRTIAKLALTYQRGGRMDAALPLLEESVAVAKAGLGPSHPETLVGMNNLAYAYRADGQIDQAIRLFEETMAAERRHLGPDHADTLTCTTNLAWAYWQARRIEDAFPLLEQVLESQKRTLGRGHRKTLESMRVLAKSYTIAGRPDKAAPTYDEYLGLIRQETSASRRAELERNLAADAAELLDERHYPTAERLARECLDLCKTWGLEGWPALQARVLLGGALSGRGDHVAAEPLLVDGYEGMKRRAAEVPAEARRDDLTRAIDYLVRMYEATDRAGEVAQLRQAESLVGEPVPPPQ